MTQTIIMVRIQRHRRFETAKLFKKNAKQNQYISNVLYLLHPEILDWVGFRAFGWEPNLGEVGGTLCFKPVSKVVYETTLYSTSFRQLW